MRRPWGNILISDNQTIFSLAWEALRQLSPRLLEPHRHCGRLEENVPGSVGERKEEFLLFSFFCKGQTRPNASHTLSSTQTIWQAIAPPDSEGDSESEDGGRPPGIDGCRPPTLHRWMHGGLSNPPSLHAISHRGTEVAHNYWVHQRPLATRLLIFLSKSSFLRAVHLPPCHSSVQGSIIGFQTRLQVRRGITPQTSVSSGELCAGHVIRIAKW